MFARLTNDDDSAEMMDEQFDESWQSERLTLNAFLDEAGIKSDS
jgi:hypothetical protein